MSQSNINRLHHVSVIVENTSRSLEFYCNVLGLEQKERPDLGYPGAWLTVGENEIHLLELPNPDPTDARPPHGGRDRHCALLVNDLDILIEALNGASVQFTLSKSGRRALFCRDPDGNTLELIEVVN